jgi:hypothetical protein
MTFGDQIRMIGGVATNGDTPTGWPAALVGARLSWATIQDESRYRTAVRRAPARSCIPGARRCPGPGRGRSRLERGFPAQATPVWCCCNARDAPAGRTAGGNRGRPHLSVSPAWDYLRIVLMRKLSCRQYASAQGTNGASTQGTNGASSRGDTQMGLPGPVAPGTLTAVCPAHPGYHTPGTSSPSHSGSADGRSRSGSPTTRNATSWTTALRLTCSSGGAPPAQPRDRGRDQAPATATGTLRAIIGLQRPCPSSAQTRAWRQKSLVVSALETLVA